MDKQLKIALIGCGRVAGHHVRSIARIPRAKTVALCDLVEERAALLAKEVQAKYYTNYHQMFKHHPDIDIVCIATPSGMHYEHMYDVISSYKKHIVIEKPMVMTPTQGQAIMELATKHRVHIFPVFQNRYNKAVQRVKKAVEQNELGDIVLTTARIRWYRPKKYYDRDPWRGTFSMDGGAMTNQGIHFIDLLRYLTGEVEKVSSLLSTYGVDIEVENTAAAVLRFKNYATGIIEITTCAFDKDYEASLSIIGSKGVAVVGGIATNKLLIFSPDPSQEIICSEEFPTIYGFGHFDILTGAVKTLLGDTSKKVISFADALETIRLLHALYHSDEIKNWVFLKDNCVSARLGASDEKIAAIYRTPSERK